MRRNVAWLLVVSMMVGSLTGEGVIHAKKRIRLNKKKIVLKVGKKKKLKLKGAKASKVKWKSKKKKIAKVNKKGLVRAKKAGKTKIIARYKKKKYVCRVIVKKKVKASEENPVESGVVSTSSSLPSAKPTGLSTVKPTVKPTAKPSVKPTAKPTVQPTAKATAKSSVAPTVEPTAIPTEEATPVVTEEPTEKPTVEPTAEPTVEATVAPTPIATAVPSYGPSSIDVPTVAPTVEPTVEPTPLSTALPSYGPSSIDVPTEEPTEEPTPKPAPEPKYYEQLSLLPTIDSVTDLKEIGKNTFTSNGRYTSINYSYSYDNVEQLQPYWDFLETCGIEIEKESDKDYLLVINKITAATVTLESGRASMTIHADAVSLLSMEKPDELHVGDRKSVV